MVCSWQAGRLRVPREAREGLAPQDSPSAEVREQDLGMGWGSRWGLHRHMASSPQGAALVPGQPSATAPSDIQTVSSATNPGRTSEGRATNLSVNASSVFNDHGQGVRFVVAKDRFSRKTGQ